MKGCIFSGDCDAIKKVGCCHFCKRKSCWKRCYDDLETCKYYADMEDTEGHDEMGEIKQRRLAGRRKAR